MPYEPTPDLSQMTLAEVADAVARRKLPPVADWNPENTGDSEMRIAADGTWYHRGSVIARPAMVRAFSSLLRREGDDYWLVVPYQKLSIEVEDAPFIAVDVKQDDEDGTPVLILRSNVEDLVTVDAQHPIVAHGDAETPALYVEMRGGLLARLDRSTYAQIAEIAIARGGDPLAVESKGAVFRLIPE